MNDSYLKYQDVANCPIRNVLDVIAGKWPMLIISVLNEGSPLCFGELNRMIPDISPKMLSQSLKMLVAEGIVSRTVIPAIPPRTRYELTGYGSTLLTAIHPMIEWAVAHFDRKKQAGYQGTI